MSSSHEEVDQDSKKRGRKDKREKKQKKARSPSSSRSPSPKKKVKESSSPTVTKKKKEKKASYEGSSNLDDYPLSASVLEGLRNKGVQELFPIQVACFGAVYDGKDVVAKARTGTGKTLAFALPIIQKVLDSKEQGGRHPLVLVVLPTRELAIQVQKDFLEVGHALRSTCIYGGAPYETQERDLRRGVDVVVGTPGRIIDFLERHVLDLSGIKYVVLDEADEMLNMGFAADVEKILGFVKDTGTKRSQKLLFSATLPSWVSQVAEKFLDNAFEVDLVGKDGQTAVAKTVRHLAITCDWRDRLNVLADVVKVYGADTKVLVFCNTKAEANQIATESDIRSISEALHGDVPQAQREKTTNGFRKGNFQCLIATDVAARGLDIEGIGLVIQTQPPTDVETYIHRSGRTGRAGRTGVSILFHTKREANLLTNIERTARFTFERVGVPQPQDLFRAAAASAKKLLSDVHDDVIPYFEDAAQELIDEKGAVHALAACLARLTNQHGEIKQRSLLSSSLGYVTITCRHPMFEFRSPMYVVNGIKKFTPDADVRDVYLTKDGTAGVADVDEASVKILEEITQKSKGRGMQFEVCTTLPELANKPDKFGGKRGGGGGGGGGRDRDSRGGGGRDRDSGFGGRDRDSRGGGGGGGRGGGGGGNYGRSPGSWRKN